MCISFLKLKMLQAKLSRWLDRPGFCIVISTKKFLIIHIFTFDQKKAWNFYVVLQFLCNESFPRQNYFCIPESFNMKISHHPFDHTITLWINSTRTQIQKVFLYLKTGLVLNVRFKDFWYTKINLTQIWYDKFS